MNKSDITKLREKIYETRLLATMIEKLTAAAGIITSRAMTYDVLEFLNYVEEHGSQLVEKLNKRAESLERELNQPEARHD